MKKRYPYHFLSVPKGLLVLSIDEVGVSRNTVFQEIRPGAGFETADFVKEKSGLPWNASVVANGHAQTEYTPPPPQLGSPGFEVNHTPRGNLVMLVVESRTTVGMQQKAPELLPR